MNRNFRTLISAWKNNLTIRYVIGLSLVAFLTILSQILIQVEARKQDRDQVLLRVLSDLSVLNKNLREDLVSYQLQSRTKDKNVFDALIMGNLDLINKTHETQLDQTEIEYPLNSIRRLVLTELEKSHVDLKTTLFHFQREFKSKRSEKMNSLVQESLGRQEKYSDKLLYAQQVIEENSTRNLKNLRNLELFFMGVTLFILLWEAIFIFRPAVNRLNRALSVRSKFISRVSHEIKNPLNAILGMGTLLADTLETPAQKVLTDRMHRAGKGLLGVLENILEYSNLSEGKAFINKQPTPILSVIEKSMELVSPEANLKNFNFYVNISPETPQFVQIDATKLQQIIYNLLNNAVKFTASGFVELAIKPIQENNSSFLQVVVSDSGPGILPEKQGVIFEAFTQEDDTIKRKHGGTGLGLAIVKDLCDLMMGSIRIDADYKNGARFIVQVPLESLSRDTFREFFQIEQSAYTNLFIFSPDKDYLNYLEQVALLFSFQPICFSTLDNIPLNLNGNSDCYLFDINAQLLNDKSNITKIEKQMHGRRTFFLLFERDYLGFINGFSMRQGLEPLIKPFLLSQFKQVLQGGELPVERLSPKNPINLSKTAKIVVIDDDVSNLEIIKSYLFSKSFEIKAFERSAEALAWILINEFDILITDMEMPGLSGYEIAAKLRENEKERHLEPRTILATSAYRENELGEDGRWKLFDGFVAKPIDREHLVQKILGTMAKRDQNISNVPAPLTSGVAHLIPQYVERKIEAIDKMLSQGENIAFDSVRKFGHQLRGTASTYGFSNIQPLAKELEFHAEKEDLWKVQALLTEMAQVFRAFSPVDSGRP